MTDKAPKARPRSDVLIQQKTCNTWRTDHEVRFGAGVIGALDTFVRSLDLQLLRENIAEDGFEPVIGLKRTKVNSALIRLGMKPKERECVFVNVSYLLDTVLGFAQDIASPRCTINVADVKRAGRHVKQTLRILAKAQSRYSAEAAADEQPAKKKRKVAAKPRKKKGPVDELVVDSDDDDAAPV